WIRIMVCWAAFVTQYSLRDVLLTALPSIAVESKNITNDYLPTISTTRSESTSTVDMSQIPSTSAESPSHSKYLYTDNLDSKARIPSKPNSTEVESHITLTNRRFILHNNHTAQDKLRSPKVHRTEGKNGSSGDVSPMLLLWKMLNGRHIGSQREIERRDNPTFVGQYTSIFGIYSPVSDDIEKKEKVDDGGDSADIWGLLRTKNHLELDVEDLGLDYDDEILEDKYGNSSLSNLK
ncbi:hypothetical protein SK128_010644, partial [Halocaridina rubra]